MQKETLILSQWRPQSERIFVIMPLRYKASLCKIFDPKCTDLSSNHSTIIPERLDPFINRYAEYTHDKWAFEKVKLVFDVIIILFFS